MGETEPTTDLGLESDQPARSAPRPEPRPESNRVRKLILIGVGLVAVVLLWLLGAAVLPRWWSQRIGGIVDGGIIGASLLGVAVGAIFSLLPVLVLYAAYRFRGGWRRLLVMVVVAALTAAPNLLTLGIVIGDGNAAHSAERTLDVEAPGFRGGTLVGVIIGVVIGALLAYLSASRRRNKRKVHELEARLATQD
ncbi:MAG: permease [Acidimicrobiales bacterium]